MAVSVVVAVACPAQAESKFFPNENNVRLQMITRATSESDWPFTAHTGWLICTYVLGQRAVYFTPGDIASEVDEPHHAVIVSIDPFETVFSNMMVNNQIVKTKGVAERIALFAPIRQMGLRLCDQPGGSVLDAGEL